MIAITKPNSAVQTATITLKGDVAQVFACMCPVAEYHWVPGWETGKILSNSGLVEEGCVFTTPNDGNPATWIVTKHDAAERSLTMYKVVPDIVITRLDIDVVEADGGADATITYCHTALGPLGDDLVKGHSEDAYSETMATWQSLINNYLAG